MPAVDEEKRVNWDSLHGKEREEEFEKLLSCSALIKAKDDWSDVFVGHTTFTSYQNMLRVYKYFDFGGADPYKISFSGKPATIYSKDDYYLLSEKKLVVMETTNGNHRNNLYKLIVPYSFLTWQRVPMANSLAKNGEEWTSIFLKHSSGTYNN